jgi:hypothetical protein
MNQSVHIECCPGCGRPMPWNDLVLPPIKRRIYDIVSRHDGISAEHLRELVWAEDPNGGPEVPAAGTTVISFAARTARVEEVARAR